MKKCKLMIEIEPQDWVVKSIRELIESYLRYVDYTAGWKQIKLSKNQLNVLNAIENNQFNVIKKSRQVGFNTIMNGIISSRLVSSDPWDIVMVTVNSRMIPDIKKEISRQTNDLINSLDIDVKLITNKSNCLMFSNGNRLQIISSESLNKEFVITSDRLINHTRWVIFDEFAFAKDQFNLFNWAAIKGKKTDQITIASTQNKKDNFFRSLYIACSKKENWNYINLKPEDSHFSLNAIENIRGSITPDLFNFEFGDGFIIPDFDDVNIGQFIKEINSFLPNDNEFTIRDFMDLINNRIITEIGK